MNICPRDIVPVTSTKPPSDNAEPKDARHCKRETHLLGRIQALEINNAPMVDVRKFTIGCQHVIEAIGTRCRKHP